MATKKSTTKANTKRTTTVKKKKTKKPVATKKATTTAPAKTKAKTTKQAANKKSAIVTKSTKISTIRHQGLRKLHVFGALLCATLAGLVIAYGADLHIGIYSSYLAENKLTDSGQLLPAFRELFSINLKHLVAGVLIFAAVHRILLLTVLKKTYDEQIEKRFTSINWLEFSLVGPLILVAVAAAIGVRDAMSLLLIIGSVVGVGVLGYLTDRYKLTGKQTLLKQKIIAEALLLPWAVIAVSVAHTYVYGFVTFEPLVYGLLGGSFFVYVLLAFTHKWQIEASSQNFVKNEKLVTIAQLMLLGLLAGLAFAV